MRLAQYLAAAGFCLALATARAEDKAVLKEGDKAPDFQVAGFRRQGIFAQAVRRQAGGGHRLVPKAFTGG
jgi:hypothetical protein